MLIIVSIVIFCCIYTMIETILSSNNSKYRTNLIIWTGCCALWAFMAYGYHKDYENVKARLDQISHTNVVTNVVTK